MREYKRKLTSSEVRYCYVTVGQGVRSHFFPPRLKSFRIRIGDEEFEVAIDSYYRIWAATLRNKIKFKEGNIFVFTKNDDGSIELSLGE